MTWLQRLKSVRLDPRATPTVTKRNYYDAAQLDSVFGIDEKTRQEQYMDETKGRGHIKRGPAGELIYARSGERVPPKAEQSFGEVVYES